LRERWFGNTGRLVREIAVEGEVELPPDDALVLEGVSDTDVLHAAHREGRPIVVRADTADKVVAALARPEVACVLVPPHARELLDLDLTELTYG
jgi:hypothetical protein